MIVKSQRIPAPTVRMTLELTERELETLRRLVSRVNPWSDDEPTQGEHDLANMIMYEINAIRHGDREG